jgi:hypothetical protein
VVGVERLVLIKKLGGIKKGVSFTRKFTGSEKGETLFVDDAWLFFLIGFYLNRQEFRMLSHSDL